MAIPTRASRRSSSLRPLQKNEPPVGLVSWPSPARLVSESAAMSMLYLLSSLATSAVLLSGLSVLVFSMSVLTFQEPIVSCMCFGVLFLCHRSQSGMLADRG